MDRPETKLESTLALAISAAERKLIDNVPHLNEGVAAAVQQTSKRPVQLSPGQLDDLADALSAKANHTGNKGLQRRLDKFVRKIDQLTGSHLLALLETEGPGAPSTDSLKLTRNKRTLAVTLSSAQREVLESVCLRKNIQRRLQGDGLRTIKFTHREVEYLHDQARMGVASASSRRKQRLRTVCNKIGKILGEPLLVPTPSR